MDILGIQPKDEQVEQRDLSIEQTMLQEMFEEMDVIEKWIMDGNCVDYASYKHKIGQHQGVRKVRARLLELIREREKG